MSGDSSIEDFNYLYDSRYLKLHRCLPVNADNCQLLLSVLKSVVTCVSLTFFSSVLYRKTKHSCQNLYFFERGGRGGKRILCPVFYYLRNNSPSFSFLMTQIKKFI